MPTVNFSSLPDDARIWVFASDRPLQGGESDLLLEEVDRFLAQWQAHGAPLRNAREWRDDRFLVIGVDPTFEQASGCSIDGLFRSLQQMERKLATGLVAGGRFFYRDAQGRARNALRGEIATLASVGQLDGTTPVFDTSITTAAAYRQRFELPAAKSWAAPLMGAQASQPSNRSATKASSARNG